MTEKMNDSQSDSSKEQKQLSRRNFLKIIGATSAIGAAGCTDKVAETVIPFVNPIEEQIPGVAVWYSSTCTECSAGCGINVRTREGRAVKVEGNTSNPINRGGLCGIGQSSVQNLYDPDRIRQPLLRNSSGGFSPIGWDQALGMVAAKLKNSNLKKAFITGELTGSLSKLVKSWSDGFKTTHAVYSPSSPTSEAKASELVYGHYGIPSYSLDKAKVILNFGADFLESWISPVEFARDWAASRKSETPARTIHVEPRLSLTGANADLWLSANPGTEIQMALFLVKQLLERGRGKNLSDWIRADLEKLVAQVNLDSVSEQTGISKEKLLLVAQYLDEAESSLVLVGGSASSTTNSLPLMVVGNALNLLLENVGKTVELSKMRRPTSSPASLTKLIKSMKKGEFDTLFVYGSNPSYHLPPSFEFDYAIKYVGMIVSFSSHMDEVTSKANLVIPINTSLEDWGDSNPRDGVYSLIQPSMMPVFDTRGIGDILLDLAKKGGNSSVGSAPDYQSYVKGQWEELFASKNVGGSFKDFWLHSLERGGFYFEPGGDNPKVKVDPGAFSLKFESATFEGSHGDPVLFPFPSVRSFDGRAANRPWLHEIPDPITQIVWDSWAEVHPETATHFGVAQGDMVSLRNQFGEINVPVYVTPYVKAGVVAVPMGHGHTAYGRYATAVKGNAILPLPKRVNKESDSIPLVSTRVSLLRARGKADTVITQGSNSQHGRELARTSFIGGALGAAMHEGHGGEDHHHELKQMYEQREHPLYKWNLVVDLAACTGCSACVVACYAENNIPVVGKKIMDQGREMSWLRIERYYDGGTSEGEELTVNFLPMMCQHCGNAGCEPVCPVYATYHNEEGLNAMVYNRCVGTRYCSNNCSYKVRRFNWFQYEVPEPLTWQLNPDVTPRGMGVMEKCSFCVQRINGAKDRAKDLGRPVQDGDVKPACVQSCPTQALYFGDINDPGSSVSKLNKSKRAYKVLDHHINTQPAVTYLEDVKYKV